MKESDKNTSSRTSSKIRSEQPKVVATTNVLSLKSDLNIRLIELAEESADDSDLGRAAVRLRNAFQQIVKACKKKVEDCSPSFEMRDDVCTDALNNMEFSEPSDSDFLRLVVVDRLGKTPSPSLVEAGVEAYKANPVVLQKILGPVMSTRLALHVSNKCYLANVPQSPESEWMIFSKRLNSQRERPLPGLVTGLVPFDEMTGGLSDLMVLAGDTGSGKTSLAQQLAIGALKADAEVGVIYIDTEMGKDSLYRRLLSREAKVEQRRLLARDRTDLETRQIEEAEHLITTSILPRHCVEAVEIHQPTKINFKWFKTLIQRQGDLWQTNKILIVVDSLQKLPVGVDDPFEAEGDASTHQRLPEVELARMRIELLLQIQRASRQILPPGGLPILVTSRIRKPPASGRLELADVLGGVDNVFDAAAVFLLEQSAEQRSDGIASSILNVAKIRDYGSCGDIRLDFDHQCSTFREVGRPVPKIVGPRQAKAERYKGKS